MSRAKLCGWRATVEMHMRRSSCLLVLVAAMSAGARGQNTGTRFWTVSDTGDGDGFIEPTESALLTLWCEFDPPQPQEGSGFAGTRYAIIGDKYWARGTAVSY